MLLRLLVVALLLSLASATRSSAPSSSSPSPSPTQWVFAEIEDSPSSPNSPSFVQYFDDRNQVRGGYGKRRMMVPYGGMDMTMNPYRRPNSFRTGMQWFTPKFGNGGSMGPDAGLSIATIMNTQRELLMRSMQGRLVGQYSFSTGGGGGGVGSAYTHSSRLHRPYGIDPYSSPFSYFSPPPPQTADPSVAHSSLQSGVNDGRVVGVNNNNGGGNTGGGNMGNNGGGNTGGDMGNNGGGNTGGDMGNNGGGDVNTGG